MRRSPAGGGQDLEGAETETPREGHGATDGTCHYQVLTQQQKSRAFYRCQATRIMTGAGNVLKKHAADQAKRAAQHDICSEVSLNDFSSKVFFDPGTYQCLENCGSVALNVVRRGGDLTSTVSVDYRTEDGTANAGSDTASLKELSSSKQARLRRKSALISSTMIFLRKTSISWFPQQREGCIRGRRLGQTQANHIDTLAGLGLPDLHVEEPVVTVSESIGVMEVKVVRPLELAVSWWCRTKP
ncbi:hypothetical protein INR49_020933 [Caranx melampygus]|nr:hypothetical protein INR49_020933 [Caranx melampygus]